MRTIIIFLAITLGTLFNPTFAADDLLDDPDEIELGQPIEFTSTSPVMFTVVNLTTGELHTSSRESQRDELAVLSIWVDKPSKLLIIAVAVTPQGPAGTPAKLVKSTKLLTIGQGTGPTPIPKLNDKFGFIKRTRDVKMTVLLPQTRAIYALTLANNYGTLSKQFTQPDLVPNPSSLEEQVKALMMATVALNRKTIPAPVPADVKAVLQSLVEAINENDEITTFEDYVQVWAEIAAGFAQH